MVEGSAIKNEMSGQSLPATVRNSYGGGEVRGASEYDDTPGGIFGHSQWQADDDRKHHSIDHLYGTLLDSSEEASRLQDEWDNYRGAAPINNLSSLFGPGRTGGVASSDGFSPWGFHSNGTSSFPTSYFADFSTTTTIPVNLDNESGQASDWTTWVLVAIFTSLIIVTIVGNVLVCLSVILVRKLRKPTNYLLVSLAISDLFVAIFVMPFAVFFEVYGGTWPFNNALCDLWVSGKFD